MNYVEDNAHAASERPRVVGSIAHAREILLCLARGINNLSDIARECHFSKSTVHRLLKSLEKYGYVIEDKYERQYYFGPMIEQLMADPAVPHRLVIMCAEDEMRKLSRLTEETVALDIMPNIQYVPLFEIPSPHDLKVSKQINRVEPAFFTVYAGAPVKSLLSQLDDEKLNIILNNIQILPETERTITDTQVLLAQIKEIRRTGYVISRGERVMSIMCIAAPVPAYYLPISLSVVGPEVRILPQSKSVIAEIKKTAQRISENITGLLEHRKTKATTTRALF